MTIQKILSKMTLSEKVGQLFQVGFIGTGITAEIKELIEDYHVGGIIYFHRNFESPDQIKVLSSALQDLAISSRNGLPLIISIDQEGGVVTRLKGVTHYPGCMIIGATRSSELSFRAGKASARELMKLGINMNLAPVLDVNNNPENPVIGVRSFGEDPELVAELGTAFIRGMQEGGIISCAKHFPGHGDTVTDSHLDLPVIKHERKRLAEVEFYPFEKAIKNGVDSIMAAHVYFPAIEPEPGIPATLSYRVLTRLLRKEMGYKGLIITDCMEMNAIAKTFGTIKGAVKAIQAGCDMVLISYNPLHQKAAIEEVISAVKSGVISEDTIEQSVTRVLKLKEKRIGLEFEEYGVFSEFIPEKIHDEGRAVSFEIARRGVTLVRDQKKLLPVREDKYNRIVILDCFQGPLSMVEDNSIEKTSLLKHLQFKNLDIVNYHLEEEKKDIQDLVFNRNDLVVFYSYDAIHNRWQERIVTRLLEQSIDVIVVAIRNPYDLRVFPKISTYLTTYDFSPTNLEVVGEIISGKWKPVGKLPVTIFPSI